MMKMRKKNNHMKNATQRLIDWVPNQSVSTLLEYFEIDVWDISLTDIQLMTECMRENLVDEIEADGFEI